MSAEDLGAGSSGRLGQEFRTNAIVGNHYRIIKRLGSGSFGDIYMGENLVSNPKMQVAIKIEPTCDKAAQLYNEFKFYRLINEKQGFPNIYWFGQWDKYNVLVMDLLGKNLEDVFEACELKFSLKTIIQLTLQLLDRFEFLHSKSIIYRDVKPENFLLGRAGFPNQNTIHIVDFGLSKEFIDPITGKHISYRTGKSLTGTARYMSINTHQGVEQSRRDDLEALAHLFVYLLRQGKLPWSGLKAPTLKERYRKIGEVKVNTPIDELCAGFPEEYANLLRYSRSLGFYDAPDYETIKAGFVELYNKMNFEDDKYDWE
ncbi:PREDICTED: casein kinase I-like, partial [Rhagoletis zephyria]|uniref:casein kinase I-like n=1 Tax=Rhagoletis zephyria TaxID=28612 RepID=UPI00081193F9